MKQKRIIISNVEFKRIILHIEGEVEGETGDSYELAFWDEEKKVKFVPQHCTWDGKKFSFTMNVLSINNETPMSSGRYYLAAMKGEKVICRSFFAEGYEPELNQEKDNPCNLIIRRNKGHYFVGYSKLDLDTEEYFLDVKVAIPEKAPFFMKRWFNSHVKKIRRNLSEISRACFVGIFKFFSKHTKRHGNRILFCSGSRAEIGGNEEFVYKRMVERGLDKQFKFRFDYKPNIDFKRSIFKKIHFVYLLATSDIILIDDYYPDIYKVDYPDDVKIIQLWHACGAFKTLGFERMDKPGAPPLNTRVHKCYTHMPVSSEHSLLHHAEGFGLDESKFYPIGVARTDIFFDEAYKKDIIQKMREEFPQAKSAKKVYMYAPTFRGENALNAYFPFNKVDLKKWGKFIKEQEALLIIKMHPFVKERVVIPEEYKNYIVDAASYREVNDILFIVDVLITDYSSIIYEFSLLGRPMYFYAFDQKMYESERDFYEPYEEMVPGKIVKSFDELLQALQQEEYSKEQMDAFVKKNFTYTDGKATDRIIDQLILGKEK